MSLYITGTLNFSAHAALCHSIQCMVCGGFGVGDFSICIMSLASLSCTSERLNMAAPDVHLHLQLMENANYQAPIQSVISLCKQWDCTHFTFAITMTTTVITPVRRMHRRGTVTNTGM